jgi:hypothetical protein
LPLPVVLGALVILAASLIAQRPLLDALVERDWPVPVLMGLSVAAGYGPSLLWLWFVSRRWGTGRVLADFGVRFRWIDLAWGPLIYVCTIVAMGATLVLFQAVDVPYRGNLDLDLTVVASWWPSVVGDVDRTRVVVLVIAAVVVAPFVEEAIFRGAVLRSLLSAMRPFLAVGLQGVLFGTAHFNPDFGRDNLGLLGVLSVAGIVLGGAAYLLRRIGPSIVAHVLMNGVAITVAMVTAT